MELYAAGFNAHHQLSQDSNESLTSFTKVATGKSIRIISTLWAVTILEIDGNIFHRGYHSSGKPELPISGVPAEDIKSAFGDLSGVVGSLTNDGNLLEFLWNREKSDELKIKRSDEKWFQKDGGKIECMSVAGCGEVAVVTSRFSSTLFFQPSAISICCQSSKNMIAGLSAIAQRSCMLRILLSCIPPILFSIP